MKLKGFSTLSPNYDLLDVKLATSEELDRLCCARCGFVSDAVFWCDCNHVYCGSCLSTQENADHDTPVVMARCVLCKRPTSSMKIKIHEEFIAQLQSLCPTCEIAVELRELKDHLRQCSSSNETPNGKGHPHQPAPTAEANGEAASRDDECVPTSPPASPMTTRMSTVRDQLVVDIVEKNDNAKRDRLNEMHHQQLRRLDAWISTRSESRRTYELMLNGVGSNPDGTRRLTTGSVTFAGNTYFFQPLEERSFEMVTLAFGNRGSTTEYMMSVSSMENGFWGRPITKAVNSNMAKVDFYDVYENHHKHQHGDWIKVEFELLHS